jgi:NAD(P)-dependent dehydrogenase (short-subunit alcohol dehydrogenase family)
MPAPSSRVVVVTGGSAGIGTAAVEKLAAGGARVVTCTRDGGRLAEAVAGFARRDSGRRGHGRRRRPRAVVETTLAEHGRIDAAVLNAGLGWAGLVEDMPGEAVTGIVALNLTGAIELTRLALPHLLAAARERGRADVVAVSSAATRSPAASPPRGPGP